jgi:hypothetical protein
MNFYDRFAIDVSTRHPAVAHIDRKGLVRMFGDMGLKSGAEIGVDRGSFSRYQLKYNDNLHLILVDPWTRRYLGNQRVRHTMNRLADYPGRFTIKWMTSVEASLQVPDRSLDYVYIDGDHHFDYVMTDIILWARKVKLGGILCGHDYDLRGYFGIKPAVDTYVKQHDIKNWFITCETGKQTPSWFWVMDYEC